MATLTKGVPAKSARDLYSELVNAFPLRPIRSDVELDKAISVINSLIDRVGLSRGEDDYLEVLGLLVEKYEAEKHPIASVSDAEMVRHLMEAKGVTQAKVAASTGIAKSTISEILAGKRALNRHQIGVLSHYFHVAPGVFVFD